MWSLRTAIQQGGITGGPVSLCADVLGYTRGSVPPSPLGPATFSLLAWARLDSSRSFNLNVVAIGADAFVVPDDWIEVDQLIHRMRQIYAQIDVGVRYVRHSWVNVADAHGLDTVTSMGDVREAPVHLGGRQRRNRPVHPRRLDGWGSAGTIEHQRPVHRQEERREVQRLVRGAHRGRHQLSQRVA